MWLLITHKHATNLQGLILMLLWFYFHLFLMCVCVCIQYVSNSAFVCVCGQTCIYHVRHAELRRQLGVSSHLLSRVRQALLLFALRASKISLVSTLQPLAEFQGFQKYCKIHAALWRLCESELKSSCLLSKQVNHWVNFPTLLYF